MLYPSIDTEDMETTKLQPFLFLQWELWPFLYDINTFAANISGNISIIPCPQIVCSPLASRVLNLVPLPLVCIAGLILNSLCLLIFSRPEFSKMCAVMKKSMMAIATINIAICAMAWAIGMIRCVAEPRDGLALLYLYTLVIPFANIMANTSTYLTVGIAFERNFYLRRLLKNVNISALAKATDKHTSITIYGSVLMLLAAMILLNLPSSLSYVFTNNSCLVSEFGKSSFRVNIYPWIRVAMLSFGPHIMLAVLNVLLIWRLRRMQRELKQMDTDVPHVNSISRRSNDQKDLPDDTR